MTILTSKPLNGTQTYNNKTIAGGYGPGNELNKLSNPLGIYVDDDQTVYIADSHNHRIIKWERGAKIGKIIAGGNGPGSRLDQLHSPTNIIVDKKKNRVIICDRKNRRVVEWSLQDRTYQKSIIENIDCYGLAMDDQGSLYVSDTNLHQVIRYLADGTGAKMVAGNKDPGNALNQLYDPRYVFVDENRSIFVTDSGNHRVMKWMQNANEGTIVAGGRGYGDGLAQLHNPQGLFVDLSGNIYVADLGNHRVMRWRKGVGTVIVDANDQDEQGKLLKFPTGLSIDQYNNLYIASVGDHRLQQFSLK